ncbi:hypothetical protein FHY29_003839 [Xanthomonas arboricola]|uniref:hypothetical protein n=1 Tax=Xanthomonas TaxID=338 RepID=UPI0011AFD5DB|nr:hypothetical protein [Xanthomonas arboricola]
MLKLPNNSLPYHLEKFIEQFSDQPDDVDLFVPSRLYLNGGLGSSAQAIQAIGRLSSNRHIRLHNETDEEEDGESPDLRAQFLHGMAALYFAHHLIKGSESLARNQTLRELVPKVLAMRSQNHKETSKNGYSALCCFSGAKNEFLPALYYKSEHFSVRAIPDISIAFKRMLEGIYLNSFRRMSEGSELYIYALLQELFSNADEHGSFNANGDVLRRSMRGIYMQVTSLAAAETIARDAGNDNALRLYLATLPLYGSFESNHSPLVLELSVFDTGPGMGLNWLSRASNVESYDDFSVEDELKAVTTCFKKRATTKSSSVHGQGLPTVLRALSKLNAFMTLRTGRISIYQDFSGNSQADFKPISRFANETLSLTSGTSFTIWFRIN